MLKDPEVDELLAPLVVGGITGPGACEIPEGRVIGAVPVTIPGILSTVTPTSDLYIPSV